LGTAIDIQTLSVDIFTGLKQQGLVLVENLNVAYESRDYSRHALDILRDMQSKSRDDANPGPDSGKLIDSGAKKHQALQQVMYAFQTEANPNVQFAEIKSLYVKDTFNWLGNEKEYETFKEGKTPYLFVCGQKGMGKTFIAYWAVKQLRALSRKNRETTVAYFFSRKSMGRIVLLSLR
jgi:chromosomal replication initiation ATPase DnaA